MEEKLKTHEIVYSLYSIIAKGAKGARPKLVGGAVIDIIEGRTPKDYDIVNGCRSFEQALKNFGYRFLTESTTATTYFRGGIKVQLLKTNVEQFDFTVSQAFVNLWDLSMGLPYVEIQNKMLIPVNYNDEKSVLNTLSRIPHWMKKGYSIKEETYHTLLNVLYKTRNSHKTNGLSLPYHS